MEREVGDGREKKRRGNCRLMLLLMEFDIPCACY